MAVPLLDLKAQNFSLKTEINQAIARVFDSQQFILGPDVKEFETEAANYIGSSYALGVSSGTDALLMALMALGINKGDEVITTPYSFFATAGSIARLGAIPKFADINPQFFNIDVSKIESLITKKTKAIMPVHLFGQSAEMSKIKEIASSYNLPVIEDAAQAIGAKSKDQQVGSIGDFGCFSFFPSKNLGCFGDAGLVTTNSKTYYDLLLSIRNHGMIANRRYYHSMVGGNFRIDTLQAAILRVKLPHLDNWISKRRSNAKLYRELLSPLTQYGLVLPFETEGAYHTYNQFVVRIPNRDKFLEKAAESDIGTMVYYPLPLHLQPCFEDLGYREGDLIESEKASRETVALPIYPELSQDSLEKVAQLISEFLKR